MKKKSVLIILAFFLVAALVTGLTLSLRPARTLTVALDTEELSYVIGYSGVSPKKLLYEEHQALLDGVFERASGDYTYVGIYRLGRRSGGGPHSVALYNRLGVETDAILYQNGLLYVPLNRRGTFAMYKNTEGLLDFSDLEALLR